MSGRALQAVLKSLGANIAVDGVDGPKTWAAYAQLQGKYPFLKDMTKAMGLNPPVVYTWEFLRDLASTVAAREGVPASYLLSTFKTENFAHEAGVRVSFKGKYKGLGQFDEPTWNSVMGLGTFSQVRDPVQSTVAIARLYKANKTSFLKRFPRGVYTDEVAYLYHNQGAPAATSYLLTGVLRWADQSPQAREKMAQARREYNGNSNRFVA